MSRRLPALKPWRVTCALKRADFVVHHVAGGHCALLHRTARISGSRSPYRNQDIMPKTLRAIIRQAGLTVDESIDLL